MSRSTSQLRRISWVVVSCVLLSCSGGGGGIAVTNTTPTGPTTPTVSFIRYATQPANAVAGQSFAVSVEFVSSAGTRVTTASGAVTLTMSDNSAITGTATVSAVNGLASFSGLSLTKAGSSLQLTAASGTYNATSNAFAVAAAVVSSSRSFFTPTTLTVNTATNVVFSFRDIYNNPTPGATVSLTSNAGSSIFTPSSGITGTDGTFATSVKATTGGTVPVSATVGGVLVSLTATVTSSVGTLFVNFKDASGNLLPSTSYTLNGPSGIFSYLSSTGADVFTASAPAGAYTVSATKSGFNTGTASGTLTAGGSLTLNVVMAVASAGCAPVNLAFPGTVSGTLSASGCLRGTLPTAYYQFTVSASQGQGATFTMTPSGFGALVAVYQLTGGSFINNSSSNPGPVGALWLLPPGTYGAQVSAINGAGSYTLRGVSGSGDLTTSTAGGVKADTVGTCPALAYLLVSITTVGQSISSTDCYVSTTTGTPVYFDSYLVYSSGACTVTMNSTALDSYLVAFDLVTGALVGNDDDSGGGLNSRLTLSSCSNLGHILEVRAYSISGSGAYTLGLSLTSSASAASATIDAFNGAEGPGAIMRRAGRAAPVMVLPKKNP
jgi:hypothetical protein